MAVTGALSGDDYLAELLTLLPPGPAWSKEADAASTRMLTALAAELARLDARAQQLIEETDPRTTAELFADWERVAGLPDTCVQAFAGEQSTAQRRLALVGRVTALGGQHKDYYIAIAAALGYTITISEFSPFRAGLSRVGDRLRTGWQFAWQVTAALNTVVPFRTGASTAGDRLNAWSNALLECVINRLKPAHTVVIFVYQ